MQRFLMKLNASDCPKGIGQPSSPTDWEGGSFRSDPPRRKIDGRLVPEDQRRSLRAGDLVAVWINEQQGGAGFTATASIASCAHDGSKLIVRVTNVVLQPRLDQTDLERLQYIVPVLGDARRSTVAQLRYVSPKDWDDLLTAATTKAGSNVRPGVSTDSNSVKHAHRRSTALFAKRFYGFDPSIWPVVSFSKDWQRNDLLRNSRPGDLMLFVGTTTEETDEEDQGRLLGIAEFGRQTIDTLDVVGVEETSERDYDEAGRFRWPKSLPIVRAWRLPERPLLLEVLSARLPMNARTMAVRLSEADTTAVMEQAREDAVIRQSDKIDRIRTRGDALRGRGPTTGPPPPGPGQHSVTRTEAEVAFTYCFRFGSRDVWKIGRARDWKARLQAVNEHVPSESIGEEWIGHLFHSWDTEQLAHDMEQRIFNILGRYRTRGERISCSKAVLERAWMHSFASTG